VLVIGGGGYMALSPAYDLDSASVITFLFGLVLLFNPARRVAQFFTKLQAHLILLEGVHSLFREIPTITDAPDATEEFNTTGDIILQDVAFRYSENAPLFDGIDIAFRGGKTTAIVGSTGSGKTTTLHSALAHINEVERKIWTAEDPVEITQKGLRQVQVKPNIGYDFAAAMRSFLRADPDVIMVGEMRDRETTQMGIEASLTGHLVFSTLHTNSAAESVTRLLDMGMDPFNFADALIAILAQRLVRTLCKNCKESYHPDKAEYDELVREYGEEMFKKKINIPYTDDLMLYRPVGCEECHNTGYRGRLGIHELLIASDTIKSLIQSRAPMAEIRDQAIEEGMTTLKQDGIEKIFEGYCDLLEVRKVCIK